MKEESEKVGLKLNIQKTKIMASSPITSWQIDGETMETVTDLFWGAPKSLQMMTADMKLKDAYSWELWPKVMINLDSILRIHLTKWLCYRNCLTPSSKEDYFMLPLPLVSRSSHSSPKVIASSQTRVRSQHLSQDKHYVSPSKLTK